MDYGSTVTTELDGETPDSLGRCFLHDLVYHLHDVSA